MTCIRGEPMRFPRIVFPVRLTALSDLATLSRNSISLGLTASSDLAALHFKTWKVTVEEAQSNAVLVHPAHKPHSPRQINSARRVDQNCFGTSVCYLSALMLGMMLFICGKCEIAGANSMLYYPSSFYPLAL